MESIKTLRYYQEEAVNASLNFSGYGGLVVCPTGAGKSLILAEICKRTSGKVLVLAHRAELIDQNSKEFEEDCGIYSASLDSKTTSRITFAQIQSAYNKKWDVDLIIVDEAHTIPTKQSSMYQTLLQGCNAQLLGLTATPYRMDSGHLVRGNDSLFSKVIYDIPYDQLVQEGYLAPLKYKAEKGIDNNDFKLKTGEIDQKEVVAKLEPKLEAILIDVRLKQIGQTLWFCPDVQFAYKVAREVNGKVIEANTQNRLEIIEDFKNCKFQNLVNVDVLTTGFNAQNIETIVFLRPTKSTSLFKQMLGRGTRLYPGKNSCLILDYTTNTECHGFLGDNTYPNKKQKSKDYKICPYCEEVVKLGTKVCEECGWVWAVVVRGERKPLDSLSIEAFEPDAEWMLDLRSMDAEFYTSKQGNKMIRVRFKVKGGSFDKYVMNNFYGKQFLGKLGIRNPGTYQNAIELINNCEKPSRVLARKNGKYFEWVDFL